MIVIMIIGILPSHYLAVYVVRQADQGMLCAMVVAKKLSKVGELDKLYFLGKWRSVR